MQCPKLSLAGHCGAVHGDLGWLAWFEDTELMGCSYTDKGRGSLALKAVCTGGCWMEELGVSGPGNTSVIETPVSNQKVSFEYERTLLEGEAS